MKKNIIIDAKCPKEGCDGELIKRINKRNGRFFFGCSKYPKCKHTETSDETPVPITKEKCWLCNCSSPPPDSTITVECETPAGKPCKPKDVLVHFPCYMDIE